MGAVTARARAELRSSWRRWLIIAILIGLFGGAATAAAAGARRTQTAYPRFLGAAKAYDMVIGGFPESFSPAEVHRALTTISRFPEVTDWSFIQLASFGAFLPSGRFVTFPDVVTIVDPDGRIGNTFDLFHLLKGRVPDPTRADEAMASLAAADHLHLSVGDVLTLPIATGPTDSDVPMVPVRIVGIEVAPGEFPVVGSTFPPIYVTPAFASAHARDIAPPDTIMIRLRHGAADVRRVQRELARHGLGQVDSPFIQSIQTERVQRTIRFESGASWLLAGLVALIALSVLGQSIARQTFLESVEHPTLRALGMSPSQLVALGLVRAGLTGVAGAALAVLTAILLSPLTPIGLARLAEPSPGIRVDALVLAIAAGATVVATIAVSLIPILRAARASGQSIGTLAAPAERPSRLVGAVARASTSAPAAVGVRMAMEAGRGRTVVPVRSAIFSLTLAVAALVAAVGFGSSLRHLIRTPALTGYTWDALLSLEDTPDDARTIAVLNADPGVAGFARGGYWDLDIRGTNVPVFITDAGPAGFAITEGRAPVTSDEVALGRTTMRRFRLGIGDTVPVSADGGPERPLRIVGEAAIPASPFGATGTSEGMALTLDGILALHPEGVTRSGVPFLVTFRSGADPDVVLARLQKALRQENVFVIRPLRGELAGLRRLSNMPNLLAGLVAGLGAATLLNTLVVTIRRRRRDLAILKSLGFVGGQVRAAVAWQAGTLAAAALVVGVPAGLAVGRWAWRLFAEQVGAVSVPIVPWVAVAVTIPGALLLAVAFSALPGRAAAHVRPAVVLRSE